MHFHIYLSICLCVCIYMIAQISLRYCSVATAGQTDGRLDHLSVQDPPGRAGGDAVTPGRRDGVLQGPTDAGRPFVCRVGGRGRLASGAVRHLISSMR